MYVRWQNTYEDSPEFQIQWLLIPGPDCSSRVSYGRFLMIIVFYSLYVLIDAAWDSSIRLIDYLYSIDSVYIFPMLLEIGLSKVRLEKDILNNEYVYFNSFSIHCAHKTRV